jgi:WD40 repeat protein
VKAPLKSLAISQSSYVISGGYDTQLRVWDSNAAIRARNGNEAQLKEKWQGSVQCFLFIYDLCLLIGHTLEINALAITNDSTRVASCSKDCSILIWSMKSRFPSNYQVRFCLYVCLTACQYVLCH